MSFAKHYLYGLLRQSFNGAITAIAGICVMADLGKLPDGITWQVVSHTFVVGLVVNAVAYFRQHPLPENLPSK
jgi:uncharacterized membrane protein